MAHNVAVDFSNMGDKIDLSPSKLVSHLQYCDKLVCVYLFNKMFLTFILFLLVEFDCSFSSCQHKHMQRRI